MKRYAIYAAGTALLTLTSGGAFAACQDEIASLSPGTTMGSTPGTTGSTSQGRVAKDGSQAPLQSSGSSTGNTGTGTGTTAANQGQGVSKDGSTMPLSNTPGGGNRQLATSQQDVQAQQKGGQAAAAAGQATGGNQGSGYHSPEMMAALDRARTMLQQGNEAGCMQAVQEAQRLRQ